jgi:hypothetical protein
MKTICGIEVPDCLDDVLHRNNTWSNEFYAWSAGNCNDFINSSDRASRCHEAAQYGSDGSTHEEHIEDFREYGKDLFRRLRHSISEQLDDDQVASDAFDACEESYLKGCDECEEWHHQNGSLKQQLS